MGNNQQKFAGKGHSLQGNGSGQPPPKRGLGAKKNRVRQPDQEEKRRQALEVCVCTARFL